MDGSIASSGSTSERLLSSSRESARDRTVAWFWMLAAAHVIVWMAVCVFTQPNMPLDMVEMLYWGQQWQFGYHKHPPLPAWTAASAWALSGGSPWALYLVTQLTVVATFWAVWQFAREALEPRAALCSVVVLEGCYYLTFMCNDLNNTIITRPMWALAILFLYRAVAGQRPGLKRLNWCLCGIVIGLGMISKYYLGVLVLCMLSVPLLVPSTRKEFKTAGPWLMTAIAFLIFLPHLIWMIDSEFISVLYVFNRSGQAAGGYSIANHITSPIGFVGSQVGAFLPVLILATPLLLNFRNRRETAVPAANDQSGDSCPPGSFAFFRKYLLIVFCGPLLIYLLLAVVTGAKIRSMWGGPLFCYLGVVLFTLIHLPADRRKVTKIIRDSLIAGCVMALAMVARNQFGPEIRNHESRVHFPGCEVAARTNEIWRSRYDTPLSIVGGEMFVAGCVSVYSDGEPDIYADMSPQQNPWTSDESLIEKGGVILWNEAEFPAGIPDEWSSRFTGLEILSPIVTESLSSRPREVRVGIAIVHPAGTSVAALQGTRNGDNKPSSARTAQTPGPVSPVVK